LWLPYNGKPNQIKVEHEKHVKNALTDIDGDNESVIFSNSIFDNYCVDLFFGDYIAESSPFMDSSM
jgi:hypothetical protein